MLSTSTSTTKSLSDKASSKYPSPIISRAIEYLVLVVVAPNSGCDCSSSRSQSKIRVSSTVRPRVDWLEVIEMMLLDGSSVWAMFMVTGALTIAFRMNQDTFWSSSAWEGSSDKLLFYGSASQTTRETMSERRTYGYLPVTMFPSDRFLLSHSASTFRFS